MFLSAVTFAKSKSKTILVKMLSQAGTGYSFNTKRSRLREKLTLLHYDPIGENKSPLCGTEENTLPLNNGLKMNLIYK
ncbi:39S ribosomal protein L33, mitochondrial [Vulpes lagopus]